MFHQGSLVLEGVTLAQVVELVIKVLVNLASGSVLDQKAAKDSESAHPQNLALMENPDMSAKRPSLCKLYPFAGRKATEGRK